MSPFVRRGDIYISKRSFHIQANINNKYITNIYDKSLTTWSGVLGTIPWGSL